MSTVAWQELLAQREIAAAATAMASPAFGIAPTHVSEPLLVLSQPEFVAAVQDALRNFSRPNALQNNPLLRSRLVVERITAIANPTQRITILQTLVQEVVESLQTSPREAKSYRALYQHLPPACRDTRAGS